MTITASSHMRAENSSCSHDSAWSEAS